ncbi:MAG: OmpA family protein [Candidatus Azobacteroides sp.]|nr:OmpA family protein [Candidatus Azobacteroides sp.]
MKAKIRVYGKSQSRTALGIINAYLKLHPDSTLSDLQQAFPQSLNPKGFTDNIIVPKEEAQKEGNEKLFFEREDELVVLKNGEKLALVEHWNKDEFDAICEHAKQYGIDVAEVEETKPFEKGSYELEYLDKSVPLEPSPDTGGKKCKCRWWWLLLLLLLLLIILFCWKKCCSGPAVNPNAALTTDTIKAPVSNATVVDSINGTPVSPSDNIGDTITLKLPDGKEWKIWPNGSEYQLYTFLNSDAKVDTLDKTQGWITLDKLYFQPGKSKLTPESENQLKNIAGILNLFPDSHIKIGGYTDNTGTESVNMKVSTERARVTAEKLIASGVGKNRVTYEGYGQQHPVCPENNTDSCRTLNRRIDVRITQK